MLGATLLSMPFASAKHEATSFLTALFTATSAVCVTGLVVVDTGTYWSTAGQIIILALIQIGGLGFMTMATFMFLLLGKKIGLKTRLLMQASLNQNHLQGIVNLGKYVLIFTFVTEAFFATALAWRFSLDMPLPRALWFGLFHSISAFNNAGFDLFGQFRSLTGYVQDVTVNLCITTLIILGGIGFSVIVDLVNWRQHKKLTTHTKLVLVVTAGLIVCGTLLFYLFENDNTIKNYTWTGKLLASYFQSVTPRTAGYNTVDISALHSYTQMMIIILMFIGASPGSTGGGIKTTTFAVLGSSILSLARGSIDVTIFRRMVPREQVAKSLAILLLAIALVLGVSTALLYTEHQDNFLLTLFETVSAFGTVGLTMGLTPHLSDAGRLIIILTMFLGRVGTMTAVLAFAERSKVTLPIKHPPGNILIG
ncbi:TrkH family potassium uptake protein [Desulfurispora thermophila]|uniref:TrkH family potassium uptake protein n=1 Tax=Desulfurispora thermophila TaxID=265470 RepID=UPI00035DEEA7|nr:TrkH family potassium uptake protein [Desulfurispora thermophila]